MILTLLQGLIFLSYVIFLWIKFKGPLPSISESWYRLKPLKLSFLFVLFCWSIGILMLFQGNEQTSLFFISGSGLCFVGASTQFKMKKDHTDIVHSVGAAIGIGGALIGIGIISSWIPLGVFILASILLSSLKIKNLTWWIEISAFVSILAGMLIF
jgi:hypothetical protein